jgi:hypothetical protein
MRKRPLLIAAGLASLGLISGLSLYGPYKEKNMDTKVNIVSAAETTGVKGDEVASPGTRTETATFAMG